MWYSGIDQHKRDYVLTTYGPDGPCVKQPFYSALVESP